MRHPHLLRSNKGVRLPNLLIAFDTETDPVPIGPDAIEARLNFGWMAVSRRHRGQRWTPPRWRRFTTPAELWAAVELVIHPGWRAVMVAHNAGFDFRVTDGFGELPRRGWELKGAVIDNPPTILRWRKARRGLMVLDSLNYWRVKLAAIGETVGLPKLQAPPDWSDQEAADAYCKRDVEIVLAAMQDLIRRIEDLDLGNFAPTFPGLAFTAFRHRHLVSPVLVDDNPKALALARTAYYGGRTEVFRLGRIRGPVDVYDATCFYASVMHDTPVPTILHGIYRSMTVAELPAATANASAVADVTLNTDQADYPLAARERLIFPVGRFRTSLAGPELAHALDRGRVVEVHRVALYDQAVLFASYVDEWWGRRQEAMAAGDDAAADFAKRMMTSLYGKFGQTGWTWDTVGPTDPSSIGLWLDLDLETGELNRYRALSGLLQRRGTTVESRESHPAIAATIASAGRVRLLTLLEAVGRATVVYVDTDSLFRLSGAPRAVLRGLVGPGLGQLRLVRHIRRLELHGLKDYTADGVRKTKGIRGDAVEVEPGVWRQEAFEGLRGAVVRGNVSRQVIRMVDRHLSGVYDKGVVLDSGEVRPYRLPGWR